ncbi:MAG: ATP-grasp domain-containing protein [Muribaculaceae bacterium]|nr:ATP-grasp domain-containing protein [Muribaculaceae bacterium]
MNKKKKILILGGTTISKQIVYAAREIGLDVYVTDYYEDSPCKAISDKNFIISCTDVDAVCDLIKKENIDGVIMGYADVLMSAYVKICEKAKLPCYANLQAIETTSNKSTFKNLCKKFNIPVVPEYSINDVNENRVKYPIIIKPVDNSGARGIYICNNKEDFNKFYNEALKYSPSKQIIIEQFLTGKEATIFYYLYDGEIYLLGVSDRHMLKYDEKLLQLPIGYTFPSINQNSFLKEENENIKMMFKSLKMKEGMVFMQSFNDNGNYIIYEMGYRLTGSIEHHLFEKAYNFNHLKAILNYAVGNKVDVSALETININNPIMANVTLLLNKGEIHHYEGITEAMNIPGVLHIHKSYKEGDIIDESIMGKLSQVGIRVLLYAESHNKLIEMMDTVKNTIKVISTDNKNMIIDNYRYKDICGI